SMLERAVSMFKYPKDRTIYVAPSVSQFDESSSSSKYHYLREVKDFKILYLSTWHLNKNIHLLPSVAVRLKSQNVRVKFLLSLSREDTAIPRKFFDELNLLRVEDYFEFIGKVEARFVHQ